ncbi:hypothetical protein SJDPG12_05025 [Porphyromonas gingivalis SJD12]|nr:hypothetical protein SJDPG12_05025 [Porphyromonas gingivalis SJD12]
MDHDHRLNISPEIAGLKILPIYIRIEGPAYTYRTLEKDSSERLVMIMIL